MINLIIDGNYVLHRLVFALHKADALSELKRSLDNNIKYWNNQTHWNNIYFVSDGKNLWRRDIYPDYKITRKKDSDIDWSHVYDVYADFKKNIHKLNKNIKVHENSEMEGDDWISYITDVSNSKSQSCFIIASDADIQQKVYCDYENLFINIVYKDGFVNQKLFLPKNYKLFLSKYSENMYDNIFGTDEKEYAYEFMQKIIKKYTIDLIDNEESLFVKLVSGDKGDNIPSVFRKTGSTGKISGIGATGAKTLYLHYKELYNEDIDFNSEIFISRLIDVVAFDKKISYNDTTSRALLESNIKMNLSIIKLDTKYLPDRILETLVENIK
jgi:hypothetical protein